jgi:hypothetical protein
LANSSWQFAKLTTFNLELLTFSTINFNFKTLTMKKILLQLFVALLFVSAASAQAPGIFNYQAVARNAVGNALASKNIGVRINVHDGSATGPTVYSEIRTLTTNPFGLFNVQIGSPGATNVSGTVAAVNWATGTKFLEVEMDQNGGSAFVAMGTTQLASVPFSLNAAGAPPIGPAGGDLFGSTYPNPTVAPLAITTGKIANAAVTTAKISDLNVTTAKIDDAAITTVKIADLNVTTAKLADAAVTTIKIADGAVTSQKITVPLIKTQSDPATLISMTNTSATNGSAGISGTTNGNGPSSFGVVGTANNGGFGVAGYSNAISVLGVAAAATGQAGRFETFNATNNTPTLGAWNGAGTGPAIDAINLGTGFAGVFTVSNPASTADALRAVTNGTGASWAIRGTSTGTNGAGLFISNNATATNNNLQSNTNGLGRAGLFNSNNATSASNAVDINVAGTGFALRAASSNATPKALLTVGALQLTGIGEAANKVLMTDAAGNATWQAVGASGALTGSGTLNMIPKFTPSGTVVGNSSLFDDGSNMAVGTTTPTHKFTVTHGGSTGIGVNSTSGFSVIDINAASGDAALRFQKAGVNQWNLRNDPTNDNLQFFELGGGGSRMVIQDATGNVGIGASLAPAYRLDVEHSGATGIRSKSSASFSVIDIDAKSGDAALRFANDGVNQWNMRNRPADNYLEIFELGGGGSRMVIQDATGNVGIGETTNPAYKLDVLHGGATGAHIKSSASFSVVDIDAASGDAALRFQKAGVNQWNLRNDPGNDNLQFFELGGGGSRMVIQDATGNVGIGPGTTPAYRLDVEHGGATGIRSKSSASFSVVDIDAASGDAALRFQKAGVNQWNTRNNPGTDDYQIFELGGGGERMRIENTTGKVVVNGDFTALGVKAFTMDHPLDPTNKTLMHAAIESNEVLNSYSGTVTTDASGKVTVNLPDYFEAINKDFRYQLTVMGTFAEAIISKEISNNKFEIATNQPNVKVSWEVKGVRNDAHMRKFPFVSVEEKSDAQKGKYIDPAAYNQPESKRVSYANAGESSLDNVKPVVAKVPNPANLSGGSLEDAPVDKASIKKADVTGSVVDVPAVTKSTKVADVTGSVVDEVKKADKKPVAKSTEKGSTEE